MRASHAIALFSMMLLAWPLLASTAPGTTPTLDAEGRWSLDSRSLTLRADEAGVTALTGLGFAPVFQIDGLGRGDALVPATLARAYASVEGLHLGGDALQVTFVRREEGMHLLLRVEDAVEGSEALRARLRVYRAHLPRIAERGEVAALFGASAHDVIHVRLIEVRDSAGRLLPAQWEPDDAGLVLVVDDADALYPITADAALSAASWFVDGDQADAFLGVAVAGLGDADGDGFGDVAIGAYQWESSGAQSEEGRALAYAGGVAGLAPTPAWTREGDQAGAFFGRRVAAAGDVNGDTYADLLVSATSWDEGNANVGRVELFLGGEDGLESTPSWTFEGSQEGETCGISIAGAGDVQKDGYDDVLVGCSGYDGEGDDAGRALLFHGSASGLGVLPSWSFAGTRAGELVGVSVAGGADLNGDTYPDVAVGAPGFADGELNEGRALVFLGGPTGLGSLPAWNESSNVAGALFGQSVAILPDCDGDGRGDLVVGAQTYEDSFAGEGAVFLYAGTSGGASASPSWSIFGGQENARLGYAVASVGDVNVDGLADLLAGAFLHDGDLADEGRMSLYLGHPEGLSDEPAFTVEGDGADARLGISVASAGDVNGDGTLDVIAGAHFYTDTLSREGRAVVFHGPLIDPPPQLGNTLTLRRDGDDLVLEWSPPVSAGGEGPVTFYRVRRDVAPDGAFPSVAETYLPSWTDVDAAVDGSAFQAYVVSAENSGADLL